MALIDRNLENRPRWQRKFIVFMDGLRHAVTNDFNVSYKIIVGVFALGVSAFWFRWMDFLLILVATSQVVAFELMNHAVEGVCNFIQPRMDGQIKIIKDVAAAAAAITMVAWVVLMLFQIGRMVRYAYTSGWFG